MLRPGEVISLDSEKPAAGGRMLARHDGQVVLVSGAIPGECVRARIESVRGGVAFAAAESIETASPDRRPPAADPTCGGNEYAHITYQRQLELKREIVRDAFARIGRIEAPPSIAAHGSPERGYRMRARLHVAGTHVGFYRQATHDLCDAATSGQLLDATCETLAAVSRALASGGVESARSLDLTENVPASDRALLLELDAGTPPRGRWDAVLAAPATSGVAISRRGRLVASRGNLAVIDEVAVPGGSLRIARQVGAFFQGNRYLLQTLVDRVLAAIPAGPLTDLYAGGGLFGLAHAAAGKGPVHLVESERLGFADLRGNAAPYAGTATVHGTGVETYLARFPQLDGTALVDPPRTGLSRETATMLGSSRSGRLVYLSCDPATLARDARRLADARFTVETVEVFDLFPMTAHVETLVVFTR
jgi:23S rRNA (uracil1939-C5)-methyltransferase